MIEIDPSLPIYQQIIDGICRLLVRGELRSGDQIPSQREMAELLKVSPNTVQRAYRDLEGMGVVTTARGQGTFVSAGPELREELRRNLLAEALRQFVQQVRGLGCAPEDIPRLVSQALAETANGSPKDDGSEDRR